MRKIRTARASRSGPHSSPARSAGSALLVASLVLGGCSSADAPVATARPEGTSEASPVETFTVDVPRISTVGVPVLGHSFSGDRVPIGFHGTEDEGSSIVEVVDGRHVERLPDLPTDGWLAAASMASTTAAVFVTADLCEDQLQEGDSGAWCPAPSPESPVLLTFDRDAGRWSTRPLPERAGGPPQIVHAFGTTVELDASSGDDDRVVLRLDTARADAEAVEVQRSGSGTCSTSQRPALRFDLSRQPPRVFSVDGAGTEVAHPLPDALSGLSQTPWGSVICHSAGRFIATPSVGDGHPSSGDGTPRTEAPASGDVPAAEVPGANVDPPPQPRPTTVHDLESSTVVTIDPPDATVNTLVSTDRFWVLATTDGLHVHTYAGDELLRQPRTAPTQLRAYDAGVLEVQYGPDGSLGIRSVTLSS